MTEAVSKTAWTVNGIIHTDGAITPLPAESRVVTEIIQSILLGKIKEWASNKGHKFTDQVAYGRSYPDSVLEIKGKLIAVDIKSARFVKGDTITRMTLGTHNGYFLEPDARKLNGGTRCYNDYAGHWVISVIYEWHPDKPTRDMVKIVAVCVGQKWQFASKISGSGDTANIGGINSLSRLKSRSSIFKNNKEFEEYWRDYSIKHPRRGRMKQQS